MSPPVRRQRASRYLRGVMVASAVALPMLSLAALGSLWLWQNGAVIIWSVAATMTAVTIYGIERWLVDRGERQAEKAAPAESPQPIGLTPREERALLAVDLIARKVDPGKLTSQDAILQLGIETVEAVAHEMHPGEKDPLWKFTVPEALAMIARTSTELNRFVLDNVPLGDRLTVGQMMTLYEWRGVVAIAEKAHDLWRILRLANPASAIAGELRERLSGRLMDDMRTEFAARLARAYVNEVGRAAIDLYSGRLRLQRVTDEPAEVVAAPVRVALLGQQGVGRTSLALALSSTASGASVVKHDESNAIDLMHDGRPFVRLIDAPALRAEEEALDEAVQLAMSADAIVWVVSATRPDRHLDARLIARVREAYAVSSERRAPPIVAAVTHIDRLRPFTEWAPPYDLSAATAPKAASIRDAVAAVAEDLALPVEDLVPVMIASDWPAYNVDVLWARLVGIVPQARQAMLARNLADVRKGGLDWGRLWGQAVNGGRVLGKTLIGGGRRSS